MAAAHFKKSLFEFLVDLRLNNSRAWFDENRERFERDVRSPMLQFIEDFEKPLRKISKHFVADPRKSGGSMFRIHRDTRFSKNKAPYKTNTSAQFRHEAGKDVHAPGFYMHLEPGNVFLAAGLWRPDSDALRAIRERIGEDGTRWKRVSRSKKFSDMFNLEGDALKRPPRGFDADHPLIEDIKRKDFIAVREISQSAVTKKSFIDEVSGTYRAAAPFVKFLTEAQRLPF